MRRLSPIIIIFIIITTMIGCTSRLRTELFVSASEVSKKVKVEQTQLVKDAVISEPFSAEPVIAGDGMTAVLILSTRWRERTEDDNKQLIHFDESWKCRLYLTIPGFDQSSDLKLMGNSFFDLLGKYELAEEEKRYKAVNGDYTIDSLSGNNLFITVNGEYKNRSDDLLKIDGNFKIKVK